MKRSLPGTVFSPLYVLQNQKDADCIASLNSFDTCNIARDCVCSACVACLKINKSKSCSNMDLREFKCI